MPDTSAVLARPEAATALDRAAGARDRGAWEEAEAAYRAALSEAPGDFQALLGAGQCARRRHDHLAALEAFRAAARVKATNPWPEIYAGDELRSLQRGHEAELCYRRALALAAGGPARLQSLLGLGHCAQSRSDHAGALDHFAAAAAVNPENPWPHLYAGHALRRLGRSEEAAASCRRAIAGEDPRARLQALVGLGLLARDRGDRPEALAMFERAAALDPTDATARLEIAAELRARGDFDGAAATAAAVLVANPRSEAALESLALTHRGAGRWEAAREVLGRLVEMNPNRPETWIDMAQIARRLGGAEAAARCLERVLACDPGNARALGELGELARLKRDFEGAATLFRRAFAAHPANPWPRIGLAQTLSDQGRPDEALDLLDEAEARAAATDPGRPAVLAKRVEVLRRAGHWTAALAQARAGVQAWPRHFALWIQRCLIELLLGDPEDMAACLDAAPVTTVTDRARVQQLRGQAAEAMWRLDDAIAHYVQALALAPDDGWIHQNMARVRLLRLDLAEVQAHLERMTRADGDYAARLGRKPRTSWTHYGEILNDFALDGQVLAALHAFRGDPPAARIDPLLAIVRRFPDSTAAAISLVIALRESGRLARVAPREQGISPIPHTIAQYWDSGSPPPDVLRVTRTWQYWHPDHAVRLFDDAAARAFLAAHYTPDVRQAYDRVREPAQKADLFRLAWLFAQGGFYVDCDDRCHAPLATVMPSDVTLALYQEDLGALGNNVIGAVPQHPVIGRALDLAVQGVQSGGQDGVWLASGPGLLTRAFAQVLAASRLGCAGWLERIAVLDRQDLFRAVAMHCALGYKVTNRHWSWRPPARRSTSPR